LSRRAAALLVLASLLVLVAAFVVFRRASPGPPEPEPAAAGEAPTPAAPAVRTVVALPLPSAGGRLAVERVEIESAAQPRARLEAAVGALLAARPASEGLSPLFPVPVRLRAVMLTPEGTAYVDLAAAEGVEPPPAGSSEELQRVYGVVHTVLDSVPEASRVVLLWNGVQRRSLSGHVDTGHPLTRFAPLEPPPARAAGDAERAGDRSADAPPPADPASPEAGATPASGAQGPPPGAAP
jgi:hypothetical protein